MTKDDALKVLNTILKNPNLIRHGLAAGVCMKALAKRLGQDEDKWEIVGLLHDADYEATKDRPAEHGLILADQARALVGEVPEDILEAVKFHNKDNIPAKESLMGWGIYCCDELTGIIIACALVRPDKKLTSVEVSSVLKKLPIKTFAAGAIREQIYLCEEKLGIPLPEFVKICLDAMKDISAEIGL